MTDPAWAQTGQVCHILLAEDDEQFRTLLAQMLRAEGYRVTECSDGFRLLGQLDSLLASPEVSAKDCEQFDLIISDIRMPGITGMSVLEGIQLFEGFPPMIMITAFGDDQTRLAARRLGAVDVIDKPFEMEELLERIRGLHKSHASE